MTNFGVNSQPSSAVKQRAEKQQNRMLNTSSSLCNLPGPYNPRIATVQANEEREPVTQKAGIKQVNDFRFKSNFDTSDLSGTKMFDKKQSLSIFGDPKGPTKVYGKGLSHDRH